jgi:mannose-6-phosphate isomerase-like protein (cupin superfamily)
MAVAGGSQVDVFELSPTAVAGMERADLADATEDPPSTIGFFDFHGCTCGVARFVGRPPWEYHADDELLHVLEGECQLTVRRASGGETRTLHAGDLVIVPRGCWHRNDAPAGVTMLFMTPTEGSTHSWDDPG